MPSALNVDDPSSVERLFGVYCEEEEPEDYKLNWWSAPVSDTDAGRAMLQASERDRIALLFLAMERYPALVAHRGPRHKVWRLIRILFMQQLPFTESDIKQMMTMRPLHTWAYVDEALKTLIRYVEQHGVTPSIETQVVPHLDDVRQDRQDSEKNRLVDRLKELTGLIRSGEWHGDEPWVVAIRASLATMDDAMRDRWYGLFVLGAHTESTKPSRSWSRQAAAQVDALGQHVFARQLATWFSLLGGAAEQPLDDRNSLILRGLAWACIPIDDTPLSQALGDLAETVLKKIPGIGPRSRKTGNACLYALSMMPGTEPLIQLSRLSLRLKGTQVQRDIEKALQTVAQRTGMTRDEIIEITVPTYGLDTDCVLRRDFGDATAEIAIVGTTRTEWRWSVSGRSQKSVPVSVRASRVDELKQSKATDREIQKTLVAQRDRLEQLFLADHSWDVAIWRERYYDHPLLKYMVRRLIWEFRVRDGDGTCGIYADEKVTDVYGRPIDLATEGMRVRLWHPTTANPDAVLAWRAFLEDRRIVQPFKQAHREIYVLTDAERATETYSNRFAAHILRQHQFNALCDQRGWRYSLQGGFDAPYNGIASREIPQWGLRAEFWIEPAGDEYTNSGLYTY